MILSEKIMGFTNDVALLQKTFLFAKCLQADLHDILDSICDFHCQMHPTHFSSSKKLFHCVSEEPFVKTVSVNATSTCPIVCFS